MPENIVVTPIGPLTLQAEGAYLTRLRFGAHALPFGGGDALLTRAREALEAYFAGRLTAFDLPLLPQGTPFQRRVWQELARIPCGQTLTYGALARLIGCPGGARAVGGACNANPLPILIPCHRVLGASGHLTGYAGGLEIKRTLLKLEGVYVGI